MPLLVNFLLTKIINNRKKLHDSKRRRYSKKAMGDSLQVKWKSTQRRRKHCTLAVVRWSQKFAPPQATFLGARDGQNLISCRRSRPLPTNPVWWGSMHAKSYCGNRPTHTQTHTHPPTHKHTRLITIHCAAASTQYNQTKRCSSPGQLWYLHPNCGTHNISPLPMLVYCVKYGCS